ncbi:DUF7563 family protein [Natronobacterium haloterrestre]
MALPNLRCDNCGHHVTDQYNRVFADNDGTLHACSHCRSQKENVQRSRNRRINLTC